MKFIKIHSKKLTVYILTVIILSVSVSNSFISANNITVTYAAGPAVLGYDVMYSICEYFGSMFLGYSCAREFPEVNIHNDDVARLGYQIIKTEWESGLFDVGTGMEGTIFHNSALLGSLDYYGQQYVFGSEAFQQIAENQFTVIQGGKNDGDGDDDDDDDNDNIIHFPKNVGDTAKKWFALTASGAAAVAGFISSEYQKWVNGEPDSILADFLADFNDTFSDYESIQNVDGSYSVSGTCTLTNNGYSVFYIFSGETIYKPFATITDNSYGVGLAFAHYFNGGSTRLSLNYEGYRDGKLRYSGSTTANGANDGYAFNIPIFSSVESALSAFKSDDFSSALNYVKTYRIADWLTDDWVGKLIDPLTGLNALSNWYNIARHQGLNALGNDPLSDDLADYLRDYFAQLGTDELPQIDPSLAPVKYPSTVEDVVIDPSANPAVYPATNPGPGTNPDPGSGSNPDGDSDSGTGSDSDVDMDENDYKVDLRGIFPFCIPFDFVALLNVLDADPVAPRFEIPVVIPALDYEETVVLDMSLFDEVAGVIRICEDVSFIIFLMFATSKVIRW